MSCCYLVCPLFATCANTGIYRPTGMSWFTCGMSGKAVFAVLTLNLTNENAQFKNEDFLLLSVGKGGRALLPFEGWVSQ